MSRLSAKPIHVPEGVSARLENGVFNVKGPKGELSRVVPRDVVLVVAENGREISVVASKRPKTANLIGTVYVSARNMVQGVSEGFSKVLEMEGVGYRASKEGNDIVFLLGFSHPVRYTPPDNVQLAVEKNTIRVVGIDKELVGKVAADIRALRPPEPYKGKGIRYQGERIMRKQGKKAGVGAT